MTLPRASGPDDVHTQVLTAVAAVKNVDPLELPPLFDVIDPDALDALFAPIGDDRTRVGTVEFPYAERTVVVEVDDATVVTVR